MSTIRERLGLTDDENQEDTINTTISNDIRSRLGITPEILEEEAKTIIPEKIQPRQKTGLKYIDANLNRLDEEHYQQALALAKTKENLKSGSNKLGGTIVNTFSELGKGIADFGESALDTMLQIGSSKYNPFMHLLYDGDVKDGQKLAEELIKEDASQKFFDETLGYQKEQSNGKTLQQNLDDNSLIKSGNFGGKLVRGIGNMLPSIAVGNTGAGQIGASILLGTNAYGGGIDQAYNEGANRTQANLYGLGSAGVELLTEKITDGIPGLKTIPGETKKEIVKNYVKDAIGEGLEEVASELANPLLKTTYKGTDAFSDYTNSDYWKGVIESGLMGSATAGVLDLPSSISGIKNITQNTLPTANQEVGKNILKTPTQVQENIQNNTNILDNQNNSQNSLKTENNNIQNDNFIFKQSNNDKINNLNDSMSKFFDNSQETIDLSNTISKVIQDKNWNVLFDDTITNSKGNPVNAQIKTLDNGELEIRINPNSNRAGEFLLVHEITHAIETDSMKQLVLDYASKNSEFNQALESLKQTYGTNDVSSEVLADISGQLFGNQEFINNLSLKQPNIFKKIYNKIVELANKITGNSKESLFIKDLKNKWENAYRTQENNLSEVDTRYHISKNARKEILDAIYNKNTNQNNMVQLRDYTPDVLVNLGIENNRIMVRKSHLKDNILTKNGAINQGINPDSANFHGLGVNKYLEVIDSLDNPIAVYQHTGKVYDPKNYVVLTNVKNTAGESIIVPILIEQKGQYNKITFDINRVKTTYGVNPIHYFNNQVKNGNLTELYNNKKSTKPSMQSGSLSASSVDNISQNNNNVNTSSTNYSIQDGKNNTWEEYLDKNYKSPGTKTDMQEIKKGNALPTFKEVQNADSNVRENAKVLPKDPTKESSYDIPKKITRKEVKQQLIKEMNITPEQLSVGDDITSINFQITDPIRLNEKVFGRELGQKINDTTINKTKHNEAERTRWLNSERDDIRTLDIKPRSKESAAVQKYGEKKYVNKYGQEVKYGDVELAAEFPNVETQNKIKRASEMLRNKYDKYIDQINETITALGYDEIPKRQDYMRHFQELNDVFSKTGVPFNLNDMKAEDLPTDINGLTEFNKPGKNWFASAQQRTGIKTNYDAITGIDGYLEGASNLIFHTEDIQRYRALSSLIRDSFGQTKGFENLNNLTESEMKQRIQDIQNNKLSKYVAWLDEQANSLAGKKGAIDRGVERAIGRRGYTFLNTIKKQVGSNMTGFNVRSSLTNLISSTIAASKTSKVGLVKGTVSTIQNMFHNDGFINKSDFLTTRFGSEQLSPKLWQKISNAGQIFMTGTDYFTSNLIVRSKYYEGLSKGLNEKQAIKYADDFGARVMGDRSKGSTAEIFNSKTLGLFTQFQLEVNNQWQYMVHDSKMDYQNIKQNKNGLKAGATVLFQLGQLAGYSYLFNELFEKLTGSRAAFDPVEILKKLFGDDDDKTFEEKMGEATSLLVDNLPFTSALNLIGVETGNNSRFPISEAFKGTNTFVKKITGQTDKYGNAISWNDVKKDVLDSAGYVALPTGYGQLKKTSKGGEMYASKLPTAGSYTDSGNLRFTADTSATGRIKAALFGQYASKESQDYIDSGFKTISSKNIDEMLDLGMTSSEYRKYREGLSKAGTKDADKLEYINNLNVTDEQKNIMANNIIKSEKYKIDMENYDDYNSYDEMKYALENPEKYLTITTITEYDKYNDIKEKIQSIKDEYSGTKNTNLRKQKVSEYIENLPYNRQKKLMIYKLIGGYSIKDSKNEMYQYIEGLNLSKSDKETIWKQLYGGD